MYWASPKFPLLSSLLTVTPAQHRPPRYAFVFVTHSLQILILFFASPLIFAICVTKPHKNFVLFPHILSIFFFCLPPFRFLFLIFQLFPRNE